MRPSVDEMGKKFGWGICPFYGLIIKALHCWRTVGATRFGAFSVKLRFDQKILWKN
jgi:hypothetical protein